MLVVVGAVLVTAVFVDAFMTTLSVSSGGGPLTSIVLGGCWRLLLRAHTQDKPSSFLTAAGTMILTVTVLIWVTLLWAGWTLVFVGSGNVVNASNHDPAELADVVYYAGFTVFTLGTGDFVTTAAAWRVVTAVASFTGLFLVTLAITYLISVVAAVVARRSLALEVRGLGDSPAAIVANGWTGDGFGDMFQQQLLALNNSVALSAEQHLAYPVLHYFHSSGPELAAPLGIANLDEALLILTEGVAPEQRPERSAVEPLRTSVGRYVATATHTAWSPDVGAPPPPDLARVARAGIPVVDGAAFDRAVAETAGRRTGLHRLVVSDGWSWSAAR